VTVSFWFKSNQTGFTSFGFRNQDIFNITYTSPAFNYPVAGVWQYYSTTVPPPPTGYTWQNNTNLGSIGLYLGGNQGAQTGSSSSVGGWSTGTAAFGYNNQINYLITGNYIAFTGVQLEKGSVATTWEQRPYATELALCQRYYEVSNGLNYMALVSAFGATYGSTTYYKVSKRANPTVSLYDNTGTGGSGASGRFTGTVSGGGGSVNGLTPSAENVGPNSFTFNGTSGYALASFGWNSSAEL